MIEWTKQIPGAPDTELELPRKTPITYHCTSKDKSASGLIFVIHGSGDDASSAYDKLLRRYIAETADLLVVTVEYHCYQVRPNSGAASQLSTETVERLSYLAAKYSIRLDAAGGNLSQVLAELGRKSNDSITLKGVLVPGNGDYQNFGALQAMDHLAVLNDIIDTGFAFDQNRIFLIGGSHGGYIGHLLVRLAPNSFLGLIDNSSYTFANYNYLGQGSEYSERAGNVKIAYNVFTEWQFTFPESPSYFGPSRAIFRDTSCYSLLAASAEAAGRKTQFIMFNTVNDTISPIVRKRKQLQNLQRAGFSASLTEITGEDLGGNLFKSVKHADAPMQKLFAHAYGQFEQRSTTLDRYRGTHISFDCHDHHYTIVHSDQPPYAELRVSENPDN
jgi:pimeloyl-ACP methyl ester carboxylesterase